MARARRRAGARERSHLDLARCIIAAHFEEKAMGGPDTLQAKRPAGIGEEEWQLRIRLAACYRLFDWLDWTDSIFNHITVRVPGPQRHFLINPFGLYFTEVNASNLVK